MDIVNLERTRGDNFPIEVTLTRNSGWTLSDSTIIMSIQFSDNIVHLLAGTLKEVGKKTVTFIPTTDIINTVRTGNYDISVDDGTYLATHMSGVLEIVDDVS